jgi:S-adenosylmethionine hydrolase
MIALFTDFGLEGPYIGQVKAVLHRLAPNVPVVDLFADIPAWRVQGAAALLASYSIRFGAGDVLLCVVDPGVGGDRPAEAIRIDGRWFVGPGNGLFESVLRQATQVESFGLAPPSETPSASFHGRDWFAPVAARLARGDTPDQAGLRSGLAVRRPDWPDDLAEIVYVDRFGNLISGVRASVLAKTAWIEIGGKKLSQARTFSDVALGRVFWYENANGLVELAVNQGRADQMLGAGVGTRIVIRSP